MDQQQAQPTNPYNPRSPVHADGRLTAFGGRDAAYARLIQYVTDSVGAHALACLGDSGSGRTALLLNVGRIFPEHIIPVYIPLGQVQIQNEADFLRLLHDAILAVLVEADFTLTRLSPFPETDEDLREWFTQVHLAELSAVIRPQRQIVLLLDDAETLTNALANGVVSGDFVAYLYEVIQHPQFSMALTFESRTNLSTVEPLIGASVVRLEALSPEETTALLRTPVAGYYHVADDAAAAVVRAAGGRPVFVQAFGEALFAAWQKTPSHTTFSATDVAQMIPQVQARCDHDLRMIWQQQIAARERTVATAIVGVKFDDPLLKLISAEQVVGWLVRTDFPLDVTAVNAAFRALEYADILTIQQGGVQFTAGLIERWLMENARLSEPVVPVMLLRMQGARLRGWFIGLIVVTLLSLVIIWVLSTTPAQLPVEQAQPTVTLVSAP